MKLKVKDFFSYGDLIIYDVIINGSPLRLKYGSEVDPKLFENTDFKKSLEKGIIKKCIDQGWIIKEEESKEEKKSNKKVESESKEAKKSDEVKEDAPSLKENIKKIFSGK